jgi:hypothetical protein
MGGGIERGLSSPLMYEKGSCTHDCRVVVGLSSWKICSTATHELTLYLNFDKKRDGVVGLRWGAEVEYASQRVECCTATSVWKCAPLKYLRRGTGNRKKTKVKGLRAFFQLANIIFFVFVSEKDINSPLFPERRTFPSLSSSLCNLNANKNQREPSPKKKPLKKKINDKAGKSLVRVKGRSKTASAQLSATSLT